LAGIKLTLLGPPALAVDGAPAGLPLGAKPLALLAYLALEDGPHQRERLAALLWGENPDAAARASLRQAVKHLRQLLGDSLCITRDSVELDRGVNCDVRRFLELARRDPAGAADFDVGRFLDGLAVRNAPLFDEWLAAKRDELLRHSREAFGQLARAAMAKWQWRDVIARADRWLELEPLSDEAARLLVEALYLAGDRPAALARFAAFRDRLKGELGTTPSRALLQLIRRIEAEAGAPPVRPITDEWQVRLQRLECRLIGRTGELETLQKAWRAARRGSGRVVLIEGEAGVGKSRLADEFFRWVGAESGTVLRARGYDARAGVPYGPIVEALRQALNAPGLSGTDPEWLAEAARLLPELRQRFRALADVTPAPSPADAWRLFEAVAQLLLAVAAEQPVAVAIDDLHWCDGDSCNLLHFLTRRLEDAPVLWCGMLTLGELRRDSPAARLCRALRVKQGSTVITVGPLSEDELWEMVREMGHVTTPTAGRRLAGRLHQVTRGNPFYVVELLKTLFAQGWLTTDPDSGEWLAAPAAPETGVMSMSLSVHDAIAERIETLPPDLHDVLITIAVAGGDCRADLLSYVHGISRLRAATIADELVERRLVEEESGSYRCAHPVIGRVVRDGLTASRRRELHRAIGRTLELLVETEGTAAPPGEIARHAEMGDDRVLAYRSSLRASEAARQRYAYEEALGWLDLAAGTAAAGAETDAVNRLTAEVLSVAGWREAPASPRRPEQARQEIERQDLDLTPRQGVAAKGRRGSEA
jgi:DNA-binding SARP family transcriptional activator